MYRNLTPKRRLELKRDWTLAVGGTQPGLVCVITELAPDNLVDSAESTAVLVGISRAVMWFGYSQWAPTWMMPA